MITDTKEVFVTEYHKLQEILNEHERSHWIADEADMRTDVEQWKSGKISEEEKSFVKMVLRLFTQADTDVCSAYVNRLLPIFKHPDSRLMLLSFANRECFDEETEVLTENGWVSISAVRSGEKIAQYNITTSAVSFDYPLDKVAREYNGVMHHYKNLRTDIMVTENHDIIVRHPTTKKIEKKKSLAGTWGRNYQYPSAGYVESFGSTLSSFDKLLVAIQADGCIVNNTPKYDRNNGSLVVDFSIKKQRKLERLKTVMDECNLSYNVRTAEDGFSRIKLSINNMEHLKDNIKNFNWFDISNISLSFAADFINEVLFWDGSGNNWYNTNLSAVDKLQAVATLCGKSATISVNRAAGNNSILGKEHETKTCYVVSFSDNEWKEYPYRKEVLYSGNVYCFTMPQGTLVTRRNGKVSIQGNCTHMLGYKRLNDTLGYDDEAFMSEFLSYSEMKNKHDFMLEETDLSTKLGIAKYLVKQSLMEGVNLFASFAMLLSFSQEGKLPGMVSVNQWSQIDESLHIAGLAELFKIFIEENPEVVNDDLKAMAYDTARKVVQMEDAFIDLCFSVGKVSCLNADDLKKYIRYVCDYRMQQLGFKAQFGVKSNPIEWMDQVTGNTFGNFFETTTVQYSKANLSGEWKY